MRMTASDRIPIGGLRWDGRLRGACDELDDSDRSSRIKATRVQGVSEVVGADTEYRFYTNQIYVMDLKHVLALAGRKKVSDVATWRHSGKPLDEWLASGPRRNRIDPAHEKEFIEMLLAGPTYTAAIKRMHAAYPQYAEGYLRARKDKIVRDGDLKPCDE